MAVTDTVLLDIKHINDEEHRKLTLHSNKNILDCARYLSEIHKPGMDTSRPYSRYYRQG